MAQEDPQHDAPYPRPAHFFLRAEGGATYRSLYGIDVGAGTMSVGAGADTRAGSFGGGLWGVFGATEEGLGIRQWGLQGEAAWMVGDRVRLGVMPRLGFLELDRFTQGGSAESMTGGFAGRIAVDIVRQSGFALAIGVEPAFDSTLQFDYGEGGGAGLFMPSIGTFLQVRYRFARRPSAL